MRTMPASLAGFPRPPGCKDFISSWLKTRTSTGGRRDATSLRQLIRLEEGIRQARQLIGGGKYQLMYGARLNRLDALAPRLVSRLVVPAVLCATSARETATPRPPGLSTPPLVFGHLWGPAAVR